MGYRGVVHLTQNNWQKMGILHLSIYRDCINGLRTLATMLVDMRVQKDGGLKIHVKEMDAKNKEFFENQATFLTKRHKDFVSFT